MREEQGGYGNVTDDTGFFRSQARVLLLKLSELRSTKKEGRKVIAIAAGSAEKRLIN